MSSDFWTVRFMRYGGRREDSLEYTDVISIPRKGEDVIVNSRSQNGGLEPGAVYRVQAVVHDFRAHAHRDRAAILIELSPIVDAVPVETSGDDS